MRTKDKNSKSNIVWMRRGGKVLSWWHRGNADTDIPQKVFLFCGVGLLIVDKLGLPAWFLIPLVSIAVIVIICIGYTDSEKGFKQLQNEYEQENMSPTNRKILSKLDTIIKQTKKEETF